MKSKCPKKANEKRGWRTGSLREIKQNRKGENDGQNNAQRDTPHSSHLPPIEWNSSQDRKPLRKK
jgi:hypothetical protein